MAEDDEHLKFTGDGFSKEPLTPEELAIQRARGHHYDRNFRPVGDLTALKGLATVAKAMPVVLKVIAGLGLIGAALGWAAEKGLI